MAIGDVVAQKSGASSLQEAIEQMEQAQSAAEERTDASGSTSVMLRLGGSEVNVSFERILVYGIVLADLLLMYIALRV